MVTREATLAFFNSDLLGIVVEEEEYVELGGQSLANAFDNHHVQIVRRSSGHYDIVDDMGADAYRFIERVSIDETPTERGFVGAPWKLSREQPDEVHDELADVAEQLAEAAI